MNSQQNFHLEELQLDIDFHHLKGPFNLFDFLSNFVAYGVEGAFSANPTRVHRRALARRNSHKYTKSRWRVAGPSRSQADGEPNNDSDSTDRAYTGSCWPPVTVQWRAPVGVLPALEHVWQPAQVHVGNGSANCAGWSCHGDSVRDRLTLAQLRSTARRCRALWRRVWWEWRQWVRLELRPAAGQRAQGVRKTLTRRRRRRSSGPLSLSLSNAESAQLESERLSISFSALTTATVADCRHERRWRRALDRALDSARREHAVLRFANELTLQSTSADRNHVLGARAISIAFQLEAARLEFAAAIRSPHWGPPPSRPAPPAVHTPVRSRNSRDGRRREVGNNFAARVGFTPFCLAASARKHSASTEFRRDHIPA